MGFLKDVKLVLIFFIYLSDERDGGGKMEIDLFFGFFLVWRNDLWKMELDR